MLNFKIDILKTPLCSSDIIAFQSHIYNYYKKHGRLFSWRQAITPYKIVVSEVMLQQTQTDRVVKKFDLFLDLFPDFSSLAEASFDNVLRVWKGLGYNRRAQNLQKIAQIIVRDYAGQLPSDQDTLQQLPGIGPATAASIVAFAFNYPSVFIETNIRSVFIYTFFRDQVAIDDKKLFPLVVKTLDVQNPRVWYYALMDYGVMLKKTVGNFSRLSSHYTKQSRFIGSDRQIRGKILQILLEQPGLDEYGIIIATEANPERVRRIMKNLEQEQFIFCKHGGWAVVR